MIDHSIPFFDFNSYNIESFRLFEDRDNICQVAYAFAANERLDMNLRCLKNRDSVICNGIDYFMRVNCHAKMREHHLVQAWGSKIRTLCEECESVGHINQFGLLSLRSWIGNIY